MKKFRADLPAWILLGGLLIFFPWLIVWADSVNGLILKDWVFAIVASAFALVFLASYQIIITPTELIFRSLFRGKKCVKHQEIKKISLEWSLRKSTQPPFQLVVARRDGKKEMKINAKVFSKAAIEAVLDLGKRVAEADDGNLLDGIVMKTLRERKRK